MINMITPLTRAISSQFITQSPPPPPPPPLPPQVNGSDSSPFPKMRNGMTGTLANSRHSTGQVKVWKSCLFSLFPQTQIHEMFPCLELSILQIWWLMNKSDLNLYLWSSYNWLTRPRLFISLLLPPDPVSHGFFQQSLAKTSADRPPQRHKKLKDNKPKVSRLLTPFLFEQFPTGFMVLIVFTEYSSLIVKSGKLSDLFFRLLVFDLSKELVYKS